MRLKLCSLKQLFLFFFSIFIFIFYSILLKGTLYNFWPSSGEKKWWKNFYKS